MITVISERKKQDVKSWRNSKRESSHIDIVLITTVRVFMIPIYKRVKVVASTL